MSRQLTASERLERMLAIVPWVAAQPGGASIEEICARFDVDRKQLLSCLERVWMVGVHPYTPDALVDLVIDSDHVQITMPDFFRRPLRLTTEQRLALLVARRAFTSVPGADTDGPLVRALDKVAGAIAVGDSEPIAMEFDPTDVDTLSLLRGAVSAARRVTFSYYSYGRDQHSTRTVEPWRVQLDGGHWYLEGRCIDADAPRVFRIDRIDDVEVTGTTFTPPTELARLEVFPRHGIDTTIVLDLAPAARWVVTQYPVQSIVDLPEGRTRVTLAIASTPWLERLLLRLGTDATIVEASEGLGSVGRDAARRLQERYRR